MSEHVIKCCVLCNKEVYEVITKCTCGSYDFEDKKDSITELTGISNVYVLLPDGSKDYITNQILKIFQPKPGAHTVAGYPILQDIIHEK